MPQITGQRSSSVEADRDSPELLDLEVASVQYAVKTPRMLNACIDPTVNDSEEAPSQ